MEYLATFGVLLVIVVAAIAASHFFPGPDDGSELYRGGMGEVDRKDAGVRTVTASPPDRKFELGKGFSGVKPRKSPTYRPRATEHVDEEKDTSADQGFRSGGGFDKDAEYNE